jgi:hypothetical protein
MMQATDWQQHSVRGFLASTVKKKLGFSLTTSKVAGDDRRYRIETRVVADMAKSSIDIAVEHARLCEMTIFELRGEWRRLHRAPAPMRLSRDLLMRGNHLQTPGEAARRPLQINPAQAGTPEPRLGGKRCAKARHADFVEGWHAAGARMARRHPYRACPCRRVRMERPALSVPHNCRP